MIIVPRCHNSLTKLPRFKGRHGAALLTQVIERDPDGQAVRKCRSETIEYSRFAVISMRDTESDPNLERARWFDGFTKRGRP